VDTTLPEVPSLARRLLCGVYEAVVLFGVVMAAGLLYGTLTDQRHALVGTTGLQAFLFVVLGIYFTWFWSHGRQTVAQKTWRMRVMLRDGRPASQARAAARYVASWLWFLPALAGVWLADVHSGAAIGWALAGGVAGYALLARLLPSRQYLHDLLCGTRLETWAPPTPHRPSVVVGQNRGG
jgi:uncharacterized RDD family membrane protein YckC